MADSIPTKESCISVTAYQGLHLVKKPTPDHFFILVSLAIVVAADSPTHPFCNLSLTTYWRRMKLLEYPRQDFLSGTDAEHHDIVTNMIQSLETPFPLENIYWSSLYFPTELQTETFNEIISRIACIARDQAGKDETEGHMGIIIRKVEKLSFDDYRKFCSQRERRERLGPLYEWILENEEEMLQQSWCRGVIKKLTMESPPGNKCFGLKSVKVEEERDDGKGCSICWSSMKRGCQAIKMPCSHLFHGFCIFQWIARRPVCPLCRFEFAPSLQWRIS